MRARKICSHPSCFNLAPCPDHGKKPWEGSTRRERTKVSTYRSQKRRKFMLKRDELTCAICGQVRLATDLQVDHVIPLAEGGPDTIENCQLACLECHSRKTSEEARRGRSG